MGGAQGKEVSEQFTIRISRQLLEELDGGAATPRPAAVRSRESRVPRRSEDSVAAVAAPSPDVRLDSDALVQQALQQSLRVGDALLKQEAAEMERIARLAQELLEKQASTHTPQLACGAERAACSACYEQHAGQPLACAPQVDAFARCVSEALQSVL